MTTPEHTCVRHPDREAIRYCQKTERWFCEECGAVCESPRIHCTFRTACAIYRDPDRRRPSRRD